MYISHTEQDGNILFSLRDRYDNLVPRDISGTIQVNTEPIQNIVFTNGVYNHRKVNSGIISVNVPELAGNTVSYSDEL